MNKINSVTDIKAILQLQKCLNIVKRLLKLPGKILNEWMNEWMN